jgi:hypothetical protein
MEQQPRFYKTLGGVFRGMAGTVIGEVIRETVERDALRLPLEVICFGNHTVKLIVSLDYRDGVPRPFLLRAWDWIGSGPGGQQGKVRGTLRILAINRYGEVVYKSVYPPERIPDA